MVSFTINILFISISFAASVDISQLLINLSDSLAPIQRLITGFAFMLGVALIFRSIYYLKVFGEARVMMQSNSSITEPLIFLFAGVILIYISSGLSIFLESSFGYENPLSYTDWRAGGDMSTPVRKSIIWFIQAIGVITFVRGTYQLTKIGQRNMQGGGLGKAVTHLFGGVLAINIVGTVNILSETLGLSTF